MTDKWSGTVTTAAALVINVAMKKYHTGFQLTAQGSNTLKLETKQPGGAYVVQTSISGESIICDLEQVEDVRLTATGGNVVFFLRLRRNFNSIPSRDWIDF